MGLFAQGKKNVAAFSNDLLCPFCGGKKWKYVEEVAQFRSRYQCKGCHRTVQYDYSNRPDHPYAPYKKGIWQEIVRRSKRATA